MFTAQELNAMTADQVHEAFKLRCAGKSAAEIRAAVLPKSKEEAAEDFGVEFVRKMNSLRQPPSEKSFLQKWHK